MSEQVPTGNALDFTLGPDAIVSFQRLSYTAWHAFAEFVDNSTQSFNDNEDELRAAAAAEGRTGPPLCVMITYSYAEDVIRIEDNAMGMNLPELKRAIHVAEPPPSPHERSQYGMGMKTAACWFGDLWTVTTKRLGDATEYTVTIDVEKIAKGHTDVGLVENAADPSKHYTKIEIRKLHRRFATKTPGKIRGFLASMYRSDIRKGRLELVWQTEVLAFQEIGQFERKPAPDDGVYRKDFEFTINGKRVTGWFGILAGEWRGRKHAGFVVMRHDRALKAHPEEWRPDTIFGDERNDLLNQRLTGEIHLDDFGVSHTKDGIQWQADEEDQVEKALAKEMEEYIKVARTLRNVDPNRGEVALRDSLTALERQLASDGFRSAWHNHPLPAPVAEVGVASLLNADGKRRLVVSLDGGKIAIGVATDASPEDPYVAHQYSADEMLLLLNGRHQYVKGLSRESLETFIRGCVFEALAEWRCQLDGADTVPVVLRRLRDSYYRSEAKKE